MEPRPPFAELAITVTPGAVSVRWCDECLLSHAFMDLYMLINHSGEVRPVATWGDHAPSDDAEAAQ